MSVDSNGGLGFQCPKCRNQVTVPATKAGTRVVCPSCKKPILVPGSQQSDEPSLDELLSLGDDPVQTKPVSVPESVEFTDESDALTLSKDDYIADEMDEAESEILELPDESSLAEKRTADSLAIEPMANQSDEEINTGAQSVGDKGNDDHQVQLLDDDDDLIKLDEAIDVSSQVGPPQPTLQEAAESDPFEHDEFAPIRIEGITQASNVVSTSCHLCGTMIHAKPSEVGTQKKCPDCHSMVEIEPEGISLNEPTQEQVEKNKQLGFGMGVASNRTSESPATESSDDYQLAPLEKNEPVDTRLEVGENDPFNEIELLEREHAEKLEELDAEAGSEIAKPDFDLPTSPVSRPAQSFGNQKGSDSSKDEAILVEPEDPTTSGDRPVKPSADSVDAIPLESNRDDTDGRHQKKKNDQASTATPSESVGSDKRSVGTSGTTDGETLDDATSDERTSDEKEPLRSKSASVDSEDPPETRFQVPDLKTAKDDLLGNDDSLSGDPSKRDGGVLGNLEIKSWLSSIASVFRDPNLLLRALVCFAFLALAYIFIDSAWSFNTSDMGPLDGLLMMGSYIMAFLTFVFAVLLTVSVAGNIVRWSTQDLESSEDRWDAVNPKPMLASFVAIGGSIAVGAAPGIILGTFFFLVTNSFIGVYLLGLMSAMALSPPCLLSSYHNDSPFQFYSKPALETFKTRKLEWARFYIGSVVVFLALVVCMLLLFINFFVVSAVVASITIALGFAYARMLGIHLNDMLNSIPATEK